MHRRVEYAYMLRCIGDRGPAGHEHRKRGGGGEVKAQGAAQAMPDGPSRECKFLPTTSRALNARFHPSKLFLYLAPSLHHRLPAPKQPHRQRSPPHFHLLPARHRRQSPRRDRCQAANLRAHSHALCAARPQGTAPSTDPAGPTLPYSHSRRRISLLALALLTTLGASHHRRTTIPRRPRCWRLS
jgi:hypothetical protein